MAAYNKWEEWCHKFDATPIPAIPSSIAVYILHLIQSNLNVATIKNFYYSIKYLHNQAGLSDPTSNVLVSNMYEAATRLSKKVTNKKHPITVDHLIRLHALLVAKTEVKLKDLRLMVICLLCFTGFLRISELLHLRHCDVQVFDTHLKLFVEKSKTDVYRDGQWVLISKATSAICPVQNLILYLQQIESSVGDKTNFIFRSIAVSKGNPDCLRQLNVPISYSTIRDQFLTSLTKIGLPCGDYGLHSLRSGGASGAANAGISDRLFKRHGRWRSETAKDGYVQDNEEALLSVSRALLL